MTYEEKITLREMRDDMADEADKKLLSKAIKHLYDLEHKLTAIRVFAKAIDAEAKIKGEE